MIDMKESDRLHKELLESAERLRKLQKSNAELKERISRPSTYRSLGLIDSIIVMACFAFFGLLFIILITAIFL